MYEYPNKQNDTPTKTKRSQQNKQHRPKPHSNERIVQIAFGIALDRIKRRGRTPCKDTLSVTNSRRLSICRDVTSRCVRKFTYISNEEAVTSNSTGSPSPGARSAESSCSNATTPVGRTAILSSPSRGSNAQYCNGSTRCYYMRSDTDRSHDTVLAGQKLLQDADNNSNENNELRNSAEAEDANKRVDSETGSGGSSNCCGGSTFRLKLDRQQLARALGPAAAATADSSSATVEFPSELLVDVNCSNGCRVSAVSLRQNDSQQCVLSLTVVEAASSAESRDEEAVSERAAKVVKEGDLEDEISSVSGGFGDTVTRR